MMKLPFFYHDVINPDLTSFSVGRSWLYFKGEALVCVVNDVENTMYFLIPPKDAAEMPVLPSMLEFRKADEDTIVQEIQKDDLIVKRVPFPELELMALRAVTANIGRNIDEGLGTTTS